MRSKFAIIVLFALIFMGCYTAEAQVRKWEAEVGVGMISPTNKLEFDRNSVGINVLAEVRRNLNTLPLDIGLRVDGNLFNRNFENLKEYKVQFKSLDVMAVADLNLFKKSKIQLFVGCGLGYGYLASNGVIEAPEGLTEIYNKYKEVKTSSVMSIMPRVGVELFHHLRATLYYRAVADKELIKEQGHFGLSLGVVIGGGVKK